ncbi:TRAP transporter substrate-binding protein DctP [Sneathiella sp. HT1-7]|uniref:TRAP transporter substrate-binding protein DctP n=1 Tax=Sneathiella sp. HT1-7 TaxID=2887192 RepID=UPI001D1527FC|nr:TRAP transporter substrate-binding protein DctP [Sneathiella sp. HT1-7]MCC3306359.1 TRAP transporter substrate-binding protein DctP [Sneathiella sp. HT1-7]
MLKRLLSAISVGVVSTVMSMSVGVAADTYTLKYGHVTAASDVSDDHIAALWLEDFLERNSNGRIQVEIFPAAQLGGFREMLEQVQLGTLEMTQTTGGGISGFFPEIQVLDIPYILPNDLVTTKLGESVFFDKVRAEVLKKTQNLRLVAVANTGNWRNFVTNKPVTDVSGLETLKIRTIDSPIQLKFTEALGANPTPVPWGELYSALSTGVVDGTKNSMADVMRFKLGEVLDHAFLDRHSFLYGYFWVSDRWLKSLPSDLQQLVVEGVTQAASIQARVNERDESVYSALFEKSGGKITLPSEADRAVMKKAQAVAKDWFVEEYGSEWLDLLEASIKEAEADIANNAERILSDN